MCDDQPAEIRPAVPQVSRRLGGAKRLDRPGIRLVRSGGLPAIKVGGRGHWRVEAEALESYVQQMYHETRQFVASHPVGSDHETAGELSTGGADLS